MRYVAGVTAGESAAGSTPAALEALAIAVRTYALANRGRHAAEGFDLCDLTHCQVLRASTRASATASERTSGRYLADHGEPAQVFYTASCGGHTERPSAVWHGAPDPPFLPSRPDSACGAEPAWQSDVPARELLRALRTGGFVGDTIRGVRITSRTASGRVAWLNVEGLAPAEVSGENLRTLVGRTLGWQLVRSTLFDVTRTGAGFHFSGHGAGHGVGLCVMGAANRARAGASAERILGDYYPGLELQTLAAAATPLRIVLPQQDEPQRGDVQRLALRALQQVGASLGAEPPASVVLRFHPTVESYQRATGQPWFTTGATRGTEVELLPLSVLRQRGLLESTVRHELAHVLTGSALEGAPRWMSEGVAVWASRAGTTSAGVLSKDSPGPLATGPGALVSSCPDDAAFRSAASADALRRLYDRAVQCYEREVRAGRSWRTMRAAQAVRH